MRASRREVLVGTGGLVVAAFGGGILGRASGSAPVAVGPTQPALTNAATNVVVPWKYAKLDPVDVAERGYAGYSAGGCMYGACEALIGALRDTVGPPYDTFPTGMTKYGKGGVVGWGTLCGALNGACAAAYLAADPKTADAVIDQLFTWYGDQALPDYTPKNPKFKIVASVADSPLCHASVTNWCVKSGFKALSPERGERCAWLTASVAKKTAELLNSVAGGEAVAPIKLTKDVTGCLACHGQGGKVENVHMSRAIDCAVCHAPGAHP